ncbi:MAG TPA: hypothetical protein VGN17_02575 [Bryobacteraceae bacterium]
MMMTVSMDTEAGNAAIRNGKLAAMIQKMVAEIKPEAVYFIADDDGHRSGIIVFDMKDSSQMPALAEPWFLGCNATVKFRPAMNPADFAAAGPAVERAIKEN